jgi:hypothetical protein
MFARTMMTTPCRIMALIFEYLVYALPIVLVLGVVLAARRALTLFVVEIENGHVQRARGRIPPSLLNDFLDVSPRGLKARLVIRCRIEQGQPRLVTRGPLSNDTQQQLRNLLGLWPLPRLKSAPKIRK